MVKAVTILAIPALLFTIQMYVPLSSICTLRIIKVPSTTYVFSLNLIEVAWLSRTVSHLVKKYIRNH